MRPPLSIHPLIDEEHAAHKAGLRSHDAFTVCRCRIVLACAEGEKPSGIARRLHCAPQMVRNVLHAFDERGRACVQRGSHVPLSVAPVLNAEGHVRALLHQSPETVANRRVSGLSNCGLTSVTS